MEVALAHLIHLIQQDDWIGPACFPERLHDEPRSAGDICTSMTSDLCLVPNTTQRNPLDGSIKGLGNGLTQGRLARTRRSYKSVSISLHV